MKILIAEDDPISRRILEANLLEWGYEVMVASDGSKAWEMIQQPESPSLIISDWMMPRLDGLALCREIRNMEKSEYIYFIILTAKGEKKDLIKGLEAGADDFLVKPFDRQELRYRLKIGERIIKLEQRILLTANTDFLTNILNRRAFMVRMEGEINRCARKNAPLSLVLSDIDLFKGINDKYGHQAGDLVLQRFAGQMAGQTRAYDFIGRYGGEEFIACLPDADAAQAALVAERLRIGVEKMAIDLPEHGKTIRLTASFGVACLNPGSDEKTDSVIKRADEALYKAKAKGRNRVCVAE